MGRHPFVHITGAGGQVGLELHALLPDATAWRRDQLDVRDAAAVDTKLAGADVVVHLAAMTNVDECERDPGLAFSVNSEGTAAVAAAARGSAARLVYVSTDYVFDGSKEGAYVEDDRPRPLNAYGASKLEGERHVLGAGDRNLVVRTSWVYGRGRNFVTTITTAAVAGKPLAVVDDQIGRPTWARDVAAALAHLVTAPVSGVVHVAGDGPPASWADVAEAALDAAGIDRTVARVDTNTYEERAGKTPAPRPRNSVLSIERARSLGVPLAPGRESLRAYVAENA